MFQRPERPTSYESSNTMTAVDDRVAPLTGPDAHRMTLVEHLEELRKRVVISVFALLVGFIIAWIISPQVVRFLTGYYRQALVELYGVKRIEAENISTKLTQTALLEGFSLRLTIAGYGGLVLALPVMLWQLWRFITPGLHRKEKQYAIPFIFSSMALFGLGVWLCLLTLPKAIEFLLEIGGTELQPLVSAEPFLSLIVKIMIAFGISFQFPVLLVFLQMAGLVRPITLLRGWRHAIVGITIFAAVITPSQDPFSLLAMTIPMVFLYFGAILIGWLLTKARRRQAAASAI